MLEPTYLPSVEPGDKFQLTQGDHEEVYVLERHLGTSKHNLGRFFSEVSRPTGHHATMNGTADMIVYVHRGDDVRGVINIVPTL